MCGLEHKLYPDKYDLESAHFRFLLKFLRESLIVFHDLSGLIVSLLSSRNVKHSSFLAKHHVDCGCERHVVLPVFQVLSMLSFSLFSVSVWTLHSVS